MCVWKNIFARTYCQIFLIFFFFYFSVYQLYFTSTRFKTSFCTVLNGNGINATRNEFSLLVHSSMYIFTHTHIDYPLRLCIPTFSMYTGNLYQNTRYPVPLTHPSTHLGKFLQKYLQVSHRKKGSATNNRTTGGSGSTIFGSFSGRKQKKVTKYLPKL